MGKWIEKLQRLWVILLVFSIILMALSSCTSTTSGPTGPNGTPEPTGVSISNASIGNDQHLILTLSNGVKVDAGKVIAPQATPLAPPSSITPAMREIFALVTPVIVRVDCQGDGFTSSGSGIIIRKDGYIITNEHVIDQTTSIKVTLSSNNQYQAIVTASDATLDLAILKLNGSPNNLPVATLGTSNDINIGENVIAAGFPLGQELPGPVSFSNGIVSSIRPINGRTFIQTDSPINPGNSGGALINRFSGKVIGITTATVSPQGQVVQDIGLAIMIDQVQAYIQKNLK